MPWTLGLMGAASVPAAFELIQTQELTGTATTVSFNAIPQIYTHLQLRVVLRRERTTGDNTFIRFNSDTTAASYFSHQLIANGTTVSSGQTSSTTVGILIGRMAGTNDGQGYVPSIVDILDYTSTTKTKTIKSLSGAANSSEQITGIRTGFWNNTSAITSILITPPSLPFSIGSRFSLYGVRG